MQTLIIPFVVFAAITLTLVAVALFVRDVVFAPKRVVAERLSWRGETIPLGGLALPRHQPPPRGLIRRIDHSFAQWVASSGIGLSPETVFLLAVALGLLLGGGLFLWRDELPWGIVGFVVGILAVAFYVIVRRYRRMRALQEQLPDAISLLARALHAGETLEQALRLVGEHTSKPLGPEFDGTARQLDLGLSIESSMRSLMYRVPVAEVQILAATLIIQRRTGGNLPQTLDRLVGVVRDRLSFRRQFRAATAGARLSTVVIAAAGPAVLAYLAFTQPEYVQRFVELELGTELLLAGIVLQLLGLVWIARLLRTNY